MPTLNQLFPSVANPADYPWLYPPPGFIPVDRNRNLALGAVPVNPVITLETIQLTTGYEGWLVSCGLQASDFSTCFFQFLNGGAPMRDYTRIEVPLGQPELPAPIFIKLEPNQPLVLTATVTGAPQALRWRLFGWYYPQR